MIETEAFDKLVVQNSAMHGGHYCKSKEAMSLVSEVMTVLMFEKVQSDQDSTSCELDHETTETKMHQALDVDRIDLREIWEESKIFHADLKKSFT